MELKCWHTDLCTNDSSLLLLSLRILPDKIIEKKYYRRRSYLETRNHPEQLGNTVPVTRSDMPTNQNICGHIVWLTHISKHDDNCSTENTKLANIHH